MFDNKPKIAFEKNENRKELIVNKIINKTWKNCKREREKRQFKNKTLNTTRPLLRCTQVLNTNTFKSN